MKLASEAEQHTSSSHHGQSHTVLRWPSPHLRTHSLFSLGRRHRDHHRHPLPLIFLEIYPRMLMELCFLFFSNISCFTALISMHRLYVHYAFSLSNDVNLLGIWCENGVQFLTLLLRFFMGRIYRFFLCISYSGYMGGGLFLEQYV